MCYFECIIRLGHVVLDPSAFCSHLVYETLQRTFHPETWIKHNCFLLEVIAMLQQIFHLSRDDLQLRSQLYLLPTGNLPPNVMIQITIYYLESLAEVSTGSIRRLDKSNKKAEFIAPSTRSLAEIFGAVGKF